jgi:HPt (histidine-containing phosphotransfer) domain-containing protein
MVPEPKILDLVDALNRTMGDIALLQMLLDDFCHMLPDFVFRFQKALENNAMVQLGKDAHKLKGVAGNLAAGKIMAAAILLDQTARQGDTLEAHDALEQLKPAIDEFVDHIARINWADI